MEAEKPEQTQKRKTGGDVALKFTSLQRPHELIVPAGAHLIFNW